MVNSIDNGEGWVSLWANTCILEENGVLGVCYFGRQRNVSVVTYCYNRERRRMGINVVTLSSPSWSLFLFYIQLVIISIPNLALY